MVVLLCTIEMNGFYHIFIWTSWWVIPHKKIHRFMIFDANAINTLDIKLDTFGFLWFLVL